MIEIIDNFLEKSDLENLQSMFIDQNFPWSYNKEIVYEGEPVDDYTTQYFSHTFYDPVLQAPISNYYQHITPILSKLDPFSIFSVRANLMTRTLTHEEMELHIDLNSFHHDLEKIKNWRTSIFYVNSNDGYTFFEDGSKVKCVENRMLIFSSDTKHSGASCTNEKARIVINFNYFPMSRK